MSSFYATTPCLVQNVWAIYMHAQKQQQSYSCCHTSLLTRQNTIETTNPCNEYEYAIIIHTKRMDKKCCKIIRLWYYARYDNCVKNETELDVTNLSQVQLYLYFSCCNNSWCRLVATKLLLSTFSTNPLLISSPK